MIELMGSLKDSKIFWKFNDFYSPIVGWDNIKEHLKVEDHNRRVQDPSPSSNPLRNLNETEISSLKMLYQKYTPIIKLLFFGITVLQLLWDIMLVCTMLYYHRMVEKVVGGLIAIVTWFFTYRFWYTSKSILPDGAGKGTFNYQQKAVQAPMARRNSLLQNKAKVSTSSELPRFMGRPIYQQFAAKRDDLNVENSIPSTGKFDFQPPPPKFL
jgi:hypothetical protein